MRKLDVIAVVRRVFATLLDGTLVMQATGMWLAVLIAAGVMEATVGSGGSVGARLGAALTGLLNAAITLIALSASAVNIHRSVLLGERPAAARVGVLEWRYLRRLFWVSLPFVLAIVVIVVPLSLEGPAGLLRSLDDRARPLAYILASLAIGLVAFVVIVPPSLALPAVVIGRSGFRIRDGYAAVRGNVLRLFAVYVAVEIVPSLAINLVSFAIRHAVLRLAPATSALAQSVAILVGSIDTILITVLSAAMLSCVYAGLVEGRPEFVRETLRRS